MRSPWPSLLAVSTWLLAPGQALAQDLSTPVKRVTQELRQVWRKDPLTKDWPFPDVVLLPDQQRALKVCPGAQAIGAVSETSAVYCPSSGRVLVDPKWLKGDIERDGEWALAYWIATGLAQAIRERIDLPGPALSGAASNLQANCVAGLLLHQAKSLWHSRKTAWDTPAFNAYAASANTSQGTAAQRSYAFLSGMGATTSSCSSVVMATLSKGFVSDPRLLRELKEDPTTRARAIQRQQSPETIPPRGLTGGLSN